MTDSAQWIEHKGKKILYLNYAGLSREALIQAVRASTAFVKAQVVPEGGVLMLVDVRDAYVGFDLFEGQRDSARRAASFIRKQAIVGVTGIKRAFVKTAGRLSGIDMRAFDTPEAAKAWLVAEGD